MYVHVYMYKYIHVCHCIPCIYGNSLELKMLISQQIDIKDRQSAKAKEDNKNLQKTLQARETELAKLEERVVSYQSSMSHCRSAW